MRILHVLMSRRVGGAESFVDALMPEMAALGEVQALHYLDDGGNRWKQWQRLRRLHESIGNFRPDVVVAHTTIPSLYARIVTPLRIATVAVLHSSGDDYKDLKFRLFEKVLQIRTSRVVAVSQVAKKKYETFLGRDDSIVVIPNGIRPIVGATEPPLQGERIVISTISRVSALKNPALWRKVAAEINARYVETDFRWYGPVAEGERFAGFIANQCDARAKFYGPTNKVPEILAETHIMFHPSDREAHSLSLVEASMVGVPIVCSTEVANAAGTEYIDAVFPAGDVSAAVDALDHVINNTKFYSSVANMRAKKAREHFSIRTCALRYQQELRALIR